MIMIGCDFHPGQQQVALLEKETGRRWEQRLSHAFGIEPVRQFYEQLRAPVRVGLEASGYSRWFEDLMEELGCELWIGDARRIAQQARRPKQRTDRRDAELILELLEQDRFPRIWTPDRETRDLRQLLLHRHKLVQMRTGIGNQLQAIAMNQGIQKKTGLWSKTGQRQLRELELPPWTRRRRDELLALRNQWEGEIAELDREVEQEARANPQARYLMSHQVGVGPVTALAMVLTLGPVERFATAKKLAAYVGLIPSEHSSGSRRRLGHLTKAGNTFLRFVLVEAAQSAVRHDPEMKRIYWRLVERRGKSIAKVAIARKLLTRLYWLLRGPGQNHAAGRRNCVAGKPEGNDIAASWRCLAE